MKFATCELLRFPKLLEFLSLSCKESPTIPRHRTNASERIEAENKPHRADVQSVGSRQLQDVKTQDDSKSRSSDFRLFRIFQNATRKPNCIVRGTVLGLRIVGTRKSAFAPPLKLPLTTS